MGRGGFQIDTDHLLRVTAFTGTDVGDLRLVSGFPSNAAIFTARGGDEYRIAVAARDAYVSGGSYDVSWEKVRWTPDLGDSFAQAGVSGLFFSLGGHTVEPGEPEGDRRSYALVVLDRAGLQSVHVEDAFRLDGTDGCRIHR